MKIVVFEAEERERGVFDLLLPANEVVFVTEPLRLANAKEHADADIVSTFIYSDLGPAVVEQLPRLKLIATRSTGYEHIDVKACKARGIAVANVPTYGSNTVAEHIFALLLAISHRLPEAIERAQRGDFSPLGLQGFDIIDKVMGVVGTGHIGRHVIQIAKGFGMKVMAFDAYPDDGAAQGMGFRYTTFDELLTRSDVISLHVPSLPETRHLLNSKTFAKMKTGVIIINTARGDLIETGGLIEALTSGKVAAAGLDVLPDEPMIREEAELIHSIFNKEHDLRNLVANHVLLRMRNVIITPHSAFNTREAVHRIAETTATNVAVFLEGRPQNLVMAK
ncbi:MAG: hydroxyacid dehydrogenase [Alphaproteobacteria bacterium]|nr:hydroxyacid dehydrogenase [Alphaproteobacteria bacterium]